MKSFFWLFFITAFFPYYTNSQVSPAIWKPVFEQFSKKSGYADDFAGFFVSSSHVSAASGVHHVYLAQQIDSILLVDGHASLHLKADGTLLKINDKFVKSINRRLIKTKNILPVALFIEDVWENMGYEVADWRLVSESTNAGRKTILQSDNFHGDVTAILRYILTENQTIKLTWEINFESLSGNENWLIHVDAGNGKILRTKNQVISCDFIRSDIERVNKAFIPKQLTPVVTQPVYRVYPLHVESPNHGSRMLLSNPADPVASPYSWHDTNGEPGPEHTTTKGNNVEAREDKDGNNSTQGEMADGGSNLVFDFPLLPGVHPHVNQNASITNLFYWNNIIHDIFYHYGFDEPSGNFQTNNYSNGGLANDHVNAQAMDGGGMNNANFFTPVDGQQPRMQMFLWTGPKSLTINQPNNLQGNYIFEKAAFGPSTFHVTGNVQLVNDGSSSPALGCDSLINGQVLEGKVALVDRGSCEFSLKCLRAQNAGAIAVIVCNNVSGNPIVMGSGTYGSNITIPSVMMTKQNCDSLKVYLNAGVNVTIIIGNPLDGDYDNGIITHEYGHGISIRLTGGAGVNNCLNNQEQMGEGWSDWFGLMLTMDEGDTESRSRGIGTYALQQPVTGQGIRPYRYSTDLNINPHTYNSIITAAVPHGVGAVWCAMLWELTWALVREYGYDPDLYNGSGGNNMALAIVTEALKLQPCNPGFTDGRNAIIMADSLLYNGANSCLIWKAFAKRGLGYSASQGSSGSKTDGIQAFDMPPACCTYVSNSSDSGNGSLRAAIACAMPGDTIRFLNFIRHDTIRLISSKLDIMKDLTISKPLNWNLTISSQGNYPVFDNSENLVLENIFIKAGTGSGVRGILNTGNLFLKSVQIADPLYDSGQGFTIQNEGEVFVEGNTSIKSD